MPSDSHQRRAKVCHNCRAKRIACYAGIDSNCCLRCQTKGLHCEAIDSGRSANGDSELRSQLARLEAVLHSLQQRERRAGSHPSASSSGQSVDSADQSQLVEVHDLVGALTKLCVTAEGPSTANTSHLSDHELVKEAKEVLSKHDVPPVAQLPASGFNFQPLSIRPTLRDLVKALPPVEECMWLLNDCYMGSWTRALHAGLFWPTWPIRIRQLYASNFSPEPHPHLLAELFGVLAIACSVLAGGRGQVAPVKSPQWEQRAARYTDLLQQALALGDYAVHPTFESVRALCLLAELHMECSGSTARFGRGLSTLPIAFNMLNSLGYHAPESDFEGRETPEQQYSRRALVIHLLRLDWAGNHAYGRRALSDPRTWPIDPPVDPRDEDLPAEARDSPFRMPPILMHCMRSRFLIGKMQQQVLADVYGDHKKVDYAAVRKYAALVEELWHEVILPGWEYKSAYSEDTTLSSDERHARRAVMAKALALVFTVHRPFIFPSETADGTVIDFEWHRSAVLKILCPFLKVWREGLQQIGLFAGGWSSALGLCLLVRFNPDDPEAVKQKGCLSVAMPRLVKMSGGVPDMIRLGHIVTFLLDTPTRRESEARPKRARRAPTARVRDKTSPALPSSDEDGYFDFDFEAASLPTPKFDSLDALEDDLRHKPANRRVSIGSNYQSILIPRSKDRALPGSLPGSDSFASMMHQALDPALSETIVSASPISPLDSDAAARKDIEDFSRLLQTLPS